MNTLLDWVTSRLGVAAFAAALFLCVQSGQDLLMSTLKAIGAFFLVRFIGQALANMTTMLDDAPVGRYASPASDQQQTAFDEDQKAA